MSKSGILVLGNQLCDPSFFKKMPSKFIFMAEDSELCTYYRFHKHKIAFFLQAMRHFAEEMSDEGFELHYEKLSSENFLSYEDKLEYFLLSQEIEELHFIEIEDKFFESRIRDLLKKLGIKAVEYTSPLFLCSRQEFSHYLENKKRPFMKTFYEAMRKKHQVLMEDGKPTGKKFSFDSENRKRLPKDFHSLEETKKGFLESELAQVIERLFESHPGCLEDYWSESTREGAKKVFREFLQLKLASFGSYQDALTRKSDFVYHSTISHYINGGLLDPTWVLHEVEKAYRKNDSIPLNAAEGFIRQVLGWREFIRGVYQNFSEQEESLNFFQHQREIPESFWEGRTGIPPVDDAVKKANRLAYCHHIERLMVLGSFMNLCQFDPREIHRWFMELFIDSSDWVMGPNVYGMALFSDGGIFATKPYICGSNYYLKMSHDYSRGEWCDVVDGLYWSFVETHRDFLYKNARMGFMIKQLEKMSVEKKEKIFNAKETFIKKGFRI